MQTFTLRRDFIPDTRIEHTVILPMGIKFIGEGWSVQAPGDWRFIGSAVMDGTPFNEARTQGAAHISLQFECAPPDVVPRSSDAERYPPPPSIMLAANNWAACVPTHQQLNTARERLIKRFDSTHTAWGEGYATLSFKGYEYERGALMRAVVNIPEWLRAIAALEWDATPASLYKAELGDMVNILLTKYNQASLVVELRTHVVCEAIQTQLRTPRAVAADARRAREERNNEDKSPSRH